MTKDVRIQKTRYLYAFLDDADEVVVEQMGVGVRVLVLDDIINYYHEGSDLVVVNRGVDGRFRTFVRRMMFCPVKDGIFRRPQVAMLFIKQSLNGTTVE